MLQEVDPKHRLQRLRRASAARLGVVRLDLANGAHHVSAIAVQAQAGRVLAGTRPEVLPEALAVIEEAASRALAEMRHIVRALREKDAGPELLAQAIRAAANGEALIAPSVTPRLLSAFAERYADAPPAQPLEPLTEREEQVLLTVARGRTNAEIADELHISLGTVKTHLTNLTQKLCARNRVEIAMWAHESGRLIDRPGRADPLLTREAS